MSNPELIVYNGVIYPRPLATVKVQALAIRNGRIRKVGSDKDILRLKSASVETVNLHGRIVVPGLTDSHIHLLSYGMLLRSLDLSGAHSIMDIQESVARDVRRRSSGSWIVGRGWDQEKLKEHRFPDKDDLNRFKSNPVFLRRICGHVGVANQKALDLARIRKETSDPEGGEIVRDCGGEPTGLLKEKAVELVDKVVPQDENEAKLALISAAMRLLMLGLTSLHCIIQNAFELRILRHLKSEGKIPQSIYAIVSPDLFQEAIRPGLSAKKGNPAFRIGGVKVFLDGSLGARTAALFKPYYDDPSSTGILRTTPEELSNIAEKAGASGVQLCMHAIGDRAVEMAVRTIENTKTRMGKGQLRHRIEHSSLANTRLIARMARSGVVASVQPRFIFSDSWAVDRLGPGRARYLYPFQSMVRSGITLAGGSDSPVEDPNPFEGIWSAVTRPGLMADERLSVSEALSCYTEWAAFASFSEGDTGTLEPGKRADLLVLDRDPFNCPLQELREVRVLKTMIGGKLSPTHRLYQADRPKTLSS